MFLTHPPTEEGELYFDTPPLLSPATRGNAAPWLLTFTIPTPLLHGSSALRTHGRRALSARMAREPALLLGIKKMQTRGVCIKGIGAGKVSEEDTLTRAVLL